MRKGLGKNKGKGYYNIVPMDSHIHSLSAKGVKTHTFMVKSKKINNAEWIKDTLEYKIGSEEGGLHKGRGLVDVEQLNAKSRKKKGDILQPLGIFATYTPDELNKYIESMSGEEKRIAYLSYGLTWNMLSKELKPYKVDIKPMGIFATKSRDELAEYMESFSDPDEKRTMYLIWGLTWNMVAKMVNKK